MKSPIVENVRTPSDIVLVTSRGLQLPYRKKTKKTLKKKKRRFYPEFPKSRILPYFLYRGAIRCKPMASTFPRPWMQSKDH